MPEPADPTVVIRERTLDAPPDAVWESLTDESLLALWLGADVELDAQEGGEGRFAFDGGETREARVDVVRTEERLAWSWWAPGEEPGRVEFRLEPVGGGTRLVVVETRAPARVGATPWDASLSALARMHGGLVCA